MKCIIKSIHFSYLPRLLKSPIRLKTVDLLERRSLFQSDVCWFTGVWFMSYQWRVKKGNQWNARYSHVNQFLSWGENGVTRRSGEWSRGRFGSEWLPREMRHSKSPCDLPGHGIPGWFVELNARFTSSNPFNGPISNSRHVAIHRFTISQQFSLKVPFMRQVSPDSRENNIFLSKLNWVLRSTFSLNYFKV